VNYSKTREQFNQPIAKFEAIQHKLAEIKVGIEATRGLIERAAWLKQSEQPYSAQAAMAKLFASEMASRSANHAVQVFGGTAIARITRSNATCVTRRLPRFTRVPARSTGW
jgi:alkylation response protein AidB-like acyl-CoA dehydrogenase